jgi:hypothetical protein
MIERSNIKHTTQAAFARELGVGRSTVAGYVRRGMPLTADGKLDRGVCLKWIGANVNVQVGARGAGVRGAERLSGAPSKANGRSKGAEPGPLTMASVRLVSLRADKLAAELEKMAGGTDDERKHWLAATLKPHAWWAIQRHTHGGCAQTLGRIAERGQDYDLMYAFDHVLDRRDRETMTAIARAIDEIVFGETELVRDGDGAPWRDGMDPQPAARRH